MADPQTQRVHIGLKRNPFDNEVVIAGILKQVRRVPCRTMTDVPRVSLMILQPAPDRRSRPTAVLVYTYPDVLLPEINTHITALCRVAGSADTFTDQGSGEVIDTARVWLNLVDED